MPYNYYPNNQYYMQNMQDLQNMRERIDKQMQQMQQQQQMPQPQQAPITQNFQLAPNPTNQELEAKYANNIDEVKNTFVIKTGIFATKDFSTIWKKDVTGNIKTYRTEEIIEMDEKDKEILMLKRQIEDMKGMISNADELHNTDVDESTTTKKPTRVSSSKSSNAK